LSVGTSNGKFDEEGLTAQVLRGNSVPFAVTDTTKDEGDNADRPF